MDQLAAHDHPPGNAGDAGLALEAVEAGVEVGEGGGQVGHLEMMPDVVTTAAGSAIMRGSASPGRRAGEEPA
ncbi:MAG: hypothetical protein AB1627_14040 [Chloroflexota bacterium]